MTQRLALHERGDGAHVAVLVHGIMGDHHTWARVEDELHSDGYRTVAVDLTGHGDSPRVKRYSPDGWARDVVETLHSALATAPDLLIGHSLGGLVASLAAPALRPRAIVYVDPAFGFPRGLASVAFKTYFAFAPRPSARIVRRSRPHWSDDEIASYISGPAKWHRRTVLGLLSTRQLQPPAPLGVPTLTVRPSRSFLVNDKVAARLRSDGGTVETLPGAGHDVHRDAHDDFMRVVRGWLAALDPVPV